MRRQWKACVQPVDELRMSRGTSFVGFTHVVVFARAMRISPVVYPSFLTQLYTTLSASSMAVFTDVVPVFSPLSTIPIATITNYLNIKGE
jgi:hypothetical protein